MSDEILQYTTRLEGARKKLAELNEQKSKPVAEENLKKATQEAQSFEAALGRIETAISGLKSGMSVNMSGDFPLSGRRRFRTLLRLFANLLSSCRR